MIQQAFITQWRERVPWANDAQVEQDLVVSRALVEIFSEIGLRAGLAFRGGTALNKLHLDSPQRYSEDIDLVQTSPGPIGDLINPIQHCLRSLLGTPSVSVRERAARLLYRFDSETQPIVPLRLKIEIDTRDHDPVLELVHRSFEVRSGWFQGKAELPTYHLDELMGTKLRSLYQRRKGRDLFDHWLVLENGLVDPDQVVACFLAYLKRQRLSVSRAQFEENLHAKMQNRSFLADAQPLLRPDTQFDPHAAFQLVMTRLVSRIPGEPWKGRKKGAPPGA
jgi:predicted nucleotidyltransferase component of viral defense system